MKKINVIGASTRAALSAGGRAKSKFLSVAAKTLALASGLAMAASIASAQSFTGLGFFTDPPVAGTESYARGVNDNGVVVGYGFIPPAPAPATGFRAFGWTQAGMVNLGTLPGGTYSVSSAVSADGLKLAGWSGRPVSPTLELTHACVWTGAGAVDLGPPGAGNSAAYGISADGSVVVGFSYLANGQLRAVRWTGGGMANLGVPSGNGWVSSVANGVSGNGSVVVGSAVKSGNSLAFRWTQSGGMQTLGTLKKGAFSEAVEANTDGSVVVGSSDSGTGSRAFRWTQSGGMKDLGVLPGQPYSYGLAISGDGSKIAGESSDGTVEVLPISGSQVSRTGRAFYWTAGTGMVDLNTYLAPLMPAGWTLRRARGISNDGTTITGWGMHDGKPEAWVARLVP